ncbi:MAG: hypothetical protein NZ561_12140, partial [Phycisphaerae bacterium]|nr:hypothetical protein [Phycisphaerae bacterium]
MRDAFPSSAAGMRLPGSVCPIPRLISPWRHVTSLLLLLLFGGVSVAYWFITRPDRVRSQTIAYLEQITGARVQVQHAALTIFDGLRLEGVRIHVESPEAEDSTLLTAEKLQIRPNLAKLLRAKIEASSILALRPRLYLVENVDRGDWNWARLDRSGGSSAAPGEPYRIRTLPAIRVRDAQVRYGRIEQGKWTTTGTMSLEAHFTPLEGTEGYEFNLQSRGGTDRLGPLASGSVQLNPLRVRARMMNVSFDRDMRVMLPEQIRQWWRRHELSGKVHIPELTFSPGPAGRQNFRAEVALEKVRVLFRPEQIQSTDELWRRAALGEMFDLLSAGGANAGRWVSRARELIEPEPIQLEDAQGAFVFTEEGIELRNLIGKVEENAIRINGRVAGYSVGAPLDVRIESLPGADIHLPPEPRWINSLPPAARETYDHLRPRGAARFHVHLQRFSPGGKVEARGQIDIVEGGFTFDRFPYPVERATGRITFGPDGSGGRDTLELTNLTGFGVMEGPNARSPVTISGIISPLSPDAGVQIIIRGRNISSEPALMRAFPPATRRALRYLDAPGAGQWPRFTGDFVCTVHRPEGPRRSWTTEVDIDIHDGEGALVAFPYHLSEVQGRLRVRKDHVDIDGATMNRDGVTVVIDGRVAWDDDEQSSPGHPPQIRPFLRIKAQNAPIDANLLGALPATHREWLRRLGVAGRFDLEGTVGDAPHAGFAGDPTPFQFSIHLKDAALWPIDGTFAVDRIAGHLELEPQKLTLRSLHGRRGDAEIVAAGSIAWPNDQPRVDLSAKATDLRLDSALYQSLPEAAKAGWDAIRPEGTVDVSL